MASITTTFYREIDDITVETVGSITFVFTVGVDSGTGGGTSDYNELSNKPSINGIELSDNKSLEDLGIATKTSDITNDGASSENPDPYVGTSEMHQYVAENAITKLVIDGKEVPITNKELSISVDDSVTVDLTGGVMTVGLSDKYKNLIYAAL